MLEFFDADTGEFRYRPNADFFGTDAFAFQANDGLVSSAAATIDIQIAPINDGPAATDDTYDLLEDSSLAIDFRSLGVLGGDVDVDDAQESLVALLVTTTSHGALVFNPDGTFSYTPVANFAGSDSFTYQARDPHGKLSNVATVTLDVAQVNDAPVAGDASFVTAEDEILIGMLPIADVDAGEEFIITLLDGPAQRRARLQPGRQLQLHAGGELLRLRQLHLPRERRRRRLERRQRSRSPSHPVNDAPVLGAIGDKPVSEGELLRFTIDASDIEQPADSLIFTASGLPAGRDLRRRRRAPSPGPRPKPRARARTISPSA